MTTQTKFIEIVGNKVEAVEFEESIISAVGLDAFGRKSPFGSLPKMGTSKYYNFLIEEYRQMKAEQEMLADNKERL